jgi:hypothetical protein
MFLLLPFIYFWALALSHFQCCSTHFFDCQSHTLLSPTCIPHCLFGIMTISTTFPSHLLTLWSLVLSVVIIWEDFPNIIFFILACMQCRLDLWITSQTRASACWNKWFWCTLTKHNLVHAYSIIPQAIAWVSTKLGWECTTLFVHVHDIYPKLWVPTWFQGTMCNWAISC